MRPERIPVYLDVRAEVVDLAAACFLQVIIYPTQQQLLGRKFHQILQTFSITQQSNQSCAEKKQTSVFSATTLSFGTEELALGSGLRTFVLGELDVSEKSDLDDLPEQTQDKVLSAFFQVLSSDVDHVAADGRCRVQCQVQVLLQQRTYALLE